MQVAALGFFITLVGVFFLWVGFLDEVTVFLVICGVLALGLGVLLIIAGIVTQNQEDKVNDEGRKEEAFKKWLQKFNDIGVSEDDLKPLHTAERYYIFKPSSHKFILMNYSATFDLGKKEVIDHFDEKSIDLTQVRKISIKNDDNVIGEINKESAVGRALLGGALFGAAGAIVGSTTAKQTQIQTKKIKSITLEIVTTDLENPYSTLFLYEDKDEAKTDFNKSEHTIKNLYWSLENYLQQKQAEQ